MLRAGGSCRKGLCGTAVQKSKQQVPPSTPRTSNPNCVRRAGCLPACRLPLLSSTARWCAGWRGTGERGGARCWWKGDPGSDKAAFYPGLKTAAAYTLQQVLIFCTLKEFIASKVSQDFSRSCKERKKPSIEVHCGICKIVITKHCPNYN